jgi:hypothetical protein
MSTVTNHDKDKAIEKLARFGMGAKGVVFVILGVLTAMAAFNEGGQKAGQSDALKFIYNQPFGQVLLALLTVGLLGYVVWRFVQAFRDPENEGDDKKGMAKRIGYGASGVLYGFLAYEAIKMLIQSGSSGGGDGNKQVVSMLLEQPFGQILVGIAAIALFVKGALEIRKAVTEKFMEEISAGRLERKIRETVKNVGKVGLIARGVVVGIIGYLFLRAAIESNASKAGGTEGAFSFIQSSSYGSILLGIVAIGLACYGVYMIVKARYKALPANM